MPNDLNLDSGIVSSRATRRAPLTSHLSELAQFAEENNLTVGSTTGGRHNRGSLHYSGNAVDIKGSGAFDDNKVKTLASKAAERGFKLRDERRRPLGQKVWGGPHVHLEFAGGQDPLNLDSGVQPPQTNAALLTPKTTVNIHEPTDEEIIRDDVTTPTKPLPFKEDTERENLLSRAFSPTVNERPSGIRGLIADKYVDPSSKKLGERRTARLTQGEAGNTDALVRAALRQLGPEYPRINEAYRQATGRNMITIDSTRVNPDGSFDFQPTKQAVDFINAFAEGHAAGGPEEGLRRAMAINVGARDEQQGAYDAARQASAGDVAAAQVAAGKTKDNFFLRGVTEGTAPLAQGVGSAIKVAGIVNPFMGRFTDPLGEEF